MAEIAGWHFWLEDRGQIRMLTIVEPDLQKAETAVLASIKGSETISYHPIPSELAAKLCMHVGQITEWASLGRKDPPALRDNFKNQDNA